MLLMIRKKNLYCIVIFIIKEVQQWPLPLFKKNLQSKTSSNRTNLAVSNLQKYHNQRNKKSPKIKSKPKPKPKKRRNEAHRPRHRPHILQVRLRLRVRDRAPRRRQENSDQHEQNHPRSTASKRHRGAHRPRVHHNQKGERFREEEQLDVVLDASGQTDGEIRHFEDREVGADIRERVLRGGGREKREKEAARWR